MIALVRYVEVSGVEEPEIADGAGHAAGVLGGFGLVEFESGAAEGGDGCVVAFDVRAGHEVGFPVGFPADAAIGCGCAAAQT
ncbi:hypothetical protein [Amycolatopsis japonica]